MNLLDDEGYPLFECLFTQAVIVPEVFYPPAEIASLSEPEVVETLCPMSVRVNPRAPWTKQKKIRFVLGRLLGTRPDGSPVVAPYVIDLGTGLPSGFTEVDSVPPEEHSIAMGSHWLSSYVLRCYSPLRCGYTTSDFSKISAMSWGDLWKMTRQRI